MRKNQLGTFLTYRTLRHPQLLTLPLELYREARAFYLRGKYGIAPSDCWSLDDYLEHVIVRGLKELTENSFAEQDFDTYKEVIAAIENSHEVDDNFEVEDWGKRLEEADERQLKAMHKLVNGWRGLWD